MLNRVTCAPVLLSETSPPAARPPPSASFSDPRRVVQSSELIRDFRTRDQSPRSPRQPTKNHRRAAMQPNGNGSPSGPDYIENFSMPDVELASKIEAYLAGITVTDHNPAILFSWDSEALEEFVQAANAEPDGHPQWFSQPRGSVSPKSVMSDIISYLAQLGGGRCDHVLLAPNSLIQYGHLQERLQYMQYDEFMQKCMANVTPGRTLARTFALTVPSIDRAVPTQCLPPPPPVRQLFE